MICVGCGGPATGELGIAVGVVCCKPCWDRFIAAFDNFGDEPPREGIALPESPTTRIADAILAALGAPPSHKIAAPVRVGNARAARRRLRRRRR